MVASAPSLSVRPVHCPAQAGRSRHADAVADAGACVGHRSGIRWHAHHSAPFLHSPLAIHLTIPAGNRNRDCTFSRHSQSRQDPSMPIPPPPPLGEVGRGPDDKGRTALCGTPFPVSCVGEVLFRAPSCTAPRCPDGSPGAGCLACTRPRWPGRPVRRCPSR